MHCHRNLLNALSLKFVTEILTVDNSEITEDQAPRTGKLSSELGTTQMANEVYYSKIFSNFSVYAKVNTGLDHKEYYELAAKDPPVADRIVELSKRYYRGQKLSEDDLPQTFFGDRGEWKIDKLPEAFFANGYIVVQQRCFDVFSKFDLGATELVPAKIYQVDRKTEVPGPFYVFNFGCVKETFPKPIWLEPVIPKDNQIAVSPLALEGPDLWFEKELSRLIFMSGRLRDALKAEKLHGPFKFYKCRVVGE
jgi:hypothetical protein